MCVSEPGKVFGILQNEEQGRERITPIVILVNVLVMLRTLILGSSSRKKLKSYMPVI